MRAALPFLLAALGACSGQPAARPASAGPPGTPFAGLTLDQRADFFEGRRDFAQAELPSDGLGPVFNDVSCVGCHSGPAAGGASERRVTRYGRMESGAFTGLVHEHILDGCGPAETAPPPGSVLAQRRTTALFGLGLVDAVPDAALRALAAAQPEEIRGVVSEAIDLVTGQPAAGKFGWKAQAPSLFQFSAQAYLDELGITSPLFPAEHCPDGDCARLACGQRTGLDDDGGDVSAVTDYVLMLAPPPPLQRGPAEEHGAAVAQQIGCLGCHVQRLETGDHRLEPLRRRTFQPFSDFLLHDMGALGDGIAQGAAGPRQMRTAPLWGLRFQPRLLHDGRAASIEDAVRAHDGQGAAAAARFAALGDRERADLVAFLASL